MSYPKYPNEVIAYLRKKELEAFRAYHGERVELRASVQPNGYRPVSEAELKAD